MLGKFFSKSPLWQHEDPAQRVRGIAELADNAHELFTLLDDAAPEVRETALLRISDVSALSDRLVTHPNDAALRTRVVELLSTTDATKREAILDKYGDESAMVALALTAPTSSLRMSAAQRIHTTAVLKHLADEARNKDHGVAKYARDRVEAQETESGRVSSATEICDALEGLLNEPGSVLSKVVELDRRYAALQPNAPHLTRYTAARATLHSRFEREQDTQRERNLWLKDFAALKSTEQSAEMSQATLDLAREQYAALEARAKFHPDLLDKLHHSGVKHAISFLETALTAQAQADALLHDFAPPVDSSTRLVEFEDRWNSIPTEGRDALRQQRFDDLLAGHRRQLSQKTAADTASQAEARQKLHSLLANAEELLTAGEIQKAATIRDELKPLRALAGELPKPTNQRLGRLSQQLGDLLRWQAFGNATQREEMCLQAEKIPQLGLGVPELAKQVQALRDQWKQLDQTQAPAPRALWERFNTACEVAYAPAAEYFGKQAEQRKEALQKREAAIKEASDYAALALTPNTDVLDWAPDWKAIGLFLSKADAQWRTLGHIDRRKIESVEAKWSAATQPLRQGVKGAQSGESSEREKLIASVKALIGQDGKLVGGAVAKVKDAQASWQLRSKSFPLPRKLEQSLWETFRTACNTVFDTLGAEKSARTSAFAQSISQRSALIDQYAALASAGDEKAIRAAISDAPREWAKLGDAGRENERKLADRFDKVLRQLRDALRSNERNKGALQLESLIAVATACARLEGELLVAEVPTAQLSDADRMRIDALPPAWKQRMNARRTTIEKAAGEPAARAAFVKKVESGREQLATALTELELELNVASASLSAQQRMQMQVARLANRLKTGNAISVQERFVEACGLNAGGDDAVIQRMVALGRVIATTPKSAI